MEEIEKDMEEYPLHPAEPAAMPESTYWPLVMAFGVMLVFWGIITSIFFVIVGVVFMGISLAGWIIDLKYE